MDLQSDTPGFKCAPVLLVGFNRPDFMASQISAIRKAAPGKLYIAVDGPRDDRPGETEKCLEVQACVKAIDWPCVVKTLFRKTNLGCKYAVSGAITWFFEHEEAGIVLEDDCRPTVDFLRFASEMLVRYKDDGRIGAVNGFNCFNLQSDEKASYHFSSHMDVWGWASWRRVWKDYDVEVARNRESLADVIRRSSMTGYSKRVYLGFLQSLKEGLSTWDVQMTLLFLAKGYLSVVPKVRLVANAGVADPRATHTGGYVYWGKYWSRAGTLDFPLVPPAFVECDYKADRLRERIEGAILPRGLTWLGAKAPCFCGVLSVMGGFLEKTLPFFFRK